MKLRNIKFNNEVKYSYAFTDESKADTWLAKMRAKPNFLPAHTVEDVDDPEVSRRAQIKAKWELVDDPVKGPAATKALLKMLLKNAMD